MVELSHKHLQVAALSLWPVGLATVIQTLGYFTIFCDPLHIVHVVVNSPLLKFHQIFLTKLPLVSH